MPTGSSGGSSAAAAQDSGRDDDSLLGCLTPAERRFVLQQRAIQVLDAARGFAQSAHYLSYMDQCAGDATLVAVWYGACPPAPNALADTISDEATMLKANGPLHYPNIRKKQN